MKKIIWIASSLFFLNAHAQRSAAPPTPSPTPPAPVAAPAAAPALPPPSRPAAVAASQDTSVMDEIEEFSNRTNLHETRDYPAVKRIVELLLIMDDRDPSRAGVMLLSYSYHQHKKMYEKAIKEVSKNKSREQKAQLQEIRVILRNYYEKGQDY